MKFFKINYVVSKNITKELFLHEIKHYQDSNIQLANGAYIRLKESGNSLFVYPYYKGFANTIRVEIDIEFANIESNKIDIILTMKPTKLMRRLILLLPISFIVQLLYLIITILTSDQELSLHFLSLPVIFLILTWFGLMLNFGERSREFYEFFKKI